MRFGNVLWLERKRRANSAGTIATGKSLTITHPEIRRFFMTTQKLSPWCCRLQPFGQSGDILVLEDGYSDEDRGHGAHVIRLSGKSRNPVPLQSLVLRDGEKLKEELFINTSSTFRRGIRKDQPRECRNRSGSGFRRQLEELRVRWCRRSGPIRTKIRRLLPDMPLCAAREPCRRFLIDHVERRVRSAGAHSQTPILFHSSYLAKGK